jgi:hypothetical protein
MTQRHLSIIQKTICFRIIFLVFLKVCDTYHKKKKNFFFGSFPPKKKKWRKSWLKSLHLQNRSNSKKKKSAIHIIAMVALAPAPAAVAGAEVIAEGILYLCGIATIALVGEKVADISSQTNDSDCCCGVRGPSGKFKQHFILKGSRKAAEEAARHYPGADGATHHTGTPSDVRPHFHPTKGGEKIHGVHFEY